MNIYIRVSKKMALESAVFWLFRMAASLQLPTSRFWYLPLKTRRAAGRFFNTSILLAWTISSKSWTLSFFGIRNWSSEFLRPQKSNIDINNCTIFQGSPPFPNHHFGYPFVSFRSWDSFTEKTRRCLASPRVTPNFLGVSLGGRKAVLNGTPPKLKTYIWGSI